MHQSTTSSRDSREQEEEKKTVEEGLAVRGRPAMMIGGFHPRGYSKTPYVCFIKGTDQPQIVMYDTYQCRFSLPTLHMESSLRDPDFSTSLSYLRQNAACCLFPKDPNKLLIVGGVSSHQVLILTYTPHYNSFTIKRAMSTLRT